jgi:hypothetical protein
MFVILSQSIQEPCVGHSGLQLKICKDVKPLEYDDQLFELLSVLFIYNESLPNTQSRSSNPIIQRYSKYLTT